MSFQNECKQMKYLFSFFILIFGICSVGQSQIPVGSWRDHFCYASVHCVAEGKNKIYAASELALFSYDKRDGSVEKLSKANGLTGAGIQTIAYDKISQNLIIVYTNSDIDILSGNTILNIPDLERKMFSGSKRINGIVCREKIAYLAADFGIITLDLESFEFGETFFIGQNSSYLKVNHIAFDDTHIYAATEEGLLYAPLASGELSNFQNWNPEENLPNNNQAVKQLGKISNFLIINRKDSENKEHLWVRKENTWEELNIDEDHLESLHSSENYLTICYKHYLQIRDENFNIKKELRKYKFSYSETPVKAHMKYAITDENGNCCIGDDLLGLVLEHDGNSQSVMPQGPCNNATAKIQYTNGQIIITNGNIKSDAWQSPVYSLFEKEQWKHISISRDTAVNLYSLAADPQTKKIYVGSWGYGLFEYTENQWSDHFKQTNSSLQALPGWEYGQIRISALGLDKNRNLWVGNVGVGKPLSVKTPDNQWKSFNGKGKLNKPKEILQILVTENNHKWVILGEGEGIFILDDNNTPLESEDDKFKKMLPQTGKTKFSAAYAAAEDHSGHIWIATEKGIIVYPNPQDAFNDNFYAQRLQLTSYANDTSEQYLMATDIVNKIEIDGANRKWLATQNSGLFLVSPEGKEQIKSFNTRNSPLISNHIRDIALNKKTGELFILTDIGIMSYKTDATDGNKNFQNAYAYPNPVRPGYEGIISITGLEQNVNVKITDITGNLVFETTSLGGQASWNGRTLNGRRVNTGVYLVFCSNKDGEKKMVTKILFIN